MSNPAIDYKLTTDQLAALGRIIITFAHIGFFINIIQQQVSANTPFDVDISIRNGRWPILNQQLRFVKAKLKAGHFPEITDLSAPLAAQISPPEDILVEHPEGGGLLLIAAEETFDIFNPQHMAAARRIRAALAPLNDLEQHERDKQRLEERRRRQEAMGFVPARNRPRDPSL
jgi:hypothetical protein